MASVAAAIGASTEGQSASIRLLAGLELWCISKLFVVMRESAMERLDWITPSCNVWCGIDELESGRLVHMDMICEIC